MVNALGLMANGWLNTILSFTLVTMIKITDQSALESQSERSVQIAHDYRKLASSISNTLAAPTSKKDKAEDAIKDAQLTYDLLAHTMSEIKIYHSVGDLVTNIPIHHSVSRATSNSFTKNSERMGNDALTA